MKNEDIIELIDWENNIIHYGECELEYARGSQIKFNLDLLEKAMMISFFWKKKYINADIFEEFYYFGETLRNNVMEEINDIISVDDLSKTDSEMITSFEPDLSTTLLSQIEIFFLILSKLKNRNLERSITLSQFAEKNFLESDKKNNKQILSLFPNLKISQLKRLYESVEMVLTKITINKIQTEMKEKLPKGKLFFCKFRK